jgi:CheY-like chemotaxis protein
MAEQREGRVLIVDKQRDSARVLRTALELTNHGYFIVIARSGEDAIQETQRMEFDILVTEFQLPGISGPELILSVRQTYPGMKAILITSAPMAEVKRGLRETGVEVLVAIFEKPIDTSRFTSAVAAAVLGEKEQRGQPVMLADDPLGEIPTFDEAAITGTLSGLLADLGCYGVTLFDRKGKALLGQGQIDDALRFSELAVLLAYNFTATAQIAGYLGESPSSAVHYYEGSWGDIYAISVGLHFFVAMVFPAHSQRQMGPVLRFGKAATQQMVNIIGPSALTVTLAAQPAEPPAPPVRRGAFEGFSDEEDADEVPMQQATLDADLAPGGEGTLDDFWSIPGEEQEAQ